MELVKKEEKAFFMPSLVKTDQSCNVFCWSVHPIRLFVRFQTCKHSISKMSELYSMQIGTSGQQGKGMKHQFW